MRKLFGLALLPPQVEAQERPGRMMMLEAGFVGGSGDACPGRYVGIRGRIAGPVSLYGMVETYRLCRFCGLRQPHRNAVSVSHRLKSGSSPNSSVPPGSAAVQFSGARSGRSGPSCSVSAPNLYRAGRR